MCPQIHKSDSYHFQKCRVQQKEFMKILTEKLSVTELKGMASSIFGDMVKGVVDVERGLLALEAQLHSDLEGLLLEDGSKQDHLWGINLYPEISGDDFLEFDSAINIRPRQGNRTRGVEDASLQKKIFEVVNKWVTR